MAPVKQAALDQTLGKLYREYGPSLQKHAAARFYSTLDKAQLDQAALGAPFCKLAAASQMDPWKMAVQVVRSYPNLVKTASGRPSQVQELAQFYVDWGDEILKSAAVRPAAGLFSKLKTFVGGKPTPKIPSVSPEAQAATSRSKQLKSRILEQRTAAGKPIPASIQSAPAPKVTKPQRQQAAAAEYQRRGVQAPARVGGGVAGAPRPAATPTGSSSIVSHQPPATRPSVAPAAAPTAAPAAAPATGTAPATAAAAGKAAPAGFMSTPTGQAVAGAGTLAGLGGLGYMTFGGGEGQPQY